MQQMRLDIMKKLMAKAEKASGEERKKLVAEIKTLQTDLASTGAKKRPADAAVDTDAANKKARPGPVLSGGPKLSGGPRRGSRARTDRESLAPRHALLVDQLVSEAGEDAPI